MTKKKLKKLKRKIRSLRRGRGNIHEHDLVSLAKQFGRRLFNTGKHPTYVSDAFPDLRPLSIPSHGTLIPATAESILDQLEEDSLRWKERLGTSKEGG